MKATVLLQLYGALRSEHLYTFETILERDFLVKGNFITLNEIDFEIGYCKQVLSAQGVKLTCLANNIHLKPDYPITKKLINFILLHLLNY